MAQNPNYAEFNNTIVTFGNWFETTLLPRAEQEGLVTDDIRQKIISYQDEFMAFKGMRITNPMTLVAHQKGMEQLLPFKANILNRDMKLVDEGKLPVDEAMNQVIKSLRQHMTSEQIAYVFDAMTDMLWHGGALTQAELDAYRANVNGAQTTTSSVADEKSDLERTMREFPELFDQLKRVLEASSSASDEMKSNLSSITPDQLAQSIMSNPRLSHLLEEGAKDDTEEEKQENGKFEQVNVMFNTSLTNVLTQMILARGRWYPGLMHAEQAYRSLLASAGASSLPCTFFTQLDEMFVKTMGYGDKTLKEQCADEKYADNVVKFITSIRIPLFDQFGLYGDGQKRPPVFETFKSDRDKPVFIGHVDELRRVAAAVRTAETQMGPMGELCSSVLSSLKLTPGQPIQPGSVNIGTIIGRTMETFNSGQSDRALVRTLRMFRDKRKRETMKDLIGSVAPGCGPLLDQVAAEADKEEAKQKQQNSK